MTSDKAAVNPVAYLIEWAEPAYRGQVTASLDPCSEEDGRSIPLVHAAALQAADTELERLREDNRFLRCMMNDAAVRELCERTEASERRVAELEKALQPFADFANRFGDYGRDDSWQLTRNPSGEGNLTMGDVRAARAVLAPAKKVD